MRRCGAILLMGIDARRRILTFRSSPSGSSSESQRIVQGSTSPTLTRWMPPPISQGQRGPGGCRRARGHRLRGEARGGGALGVQVWQTRGLSSRARERCFVVRSSSSGASGSRANARGFRRDARQSSRLPRCRRPNRRIVNQARWRVVRSIDESRAHALARAFLARQ